jgi:hypothetical protein
VRQVEEQLGGALPPTEFLNNYETATYLILQIPHKFSKEVEKLQKQKLLNFSSSTTFSIIFFSNSA